MKRIQKSQVSIWMDKVFRTSFGTTFEAASGMFKQLYIFLVFLCPLCLNGQSQSDSAFRRTVKYLENNSKGYEKLKEACATIGHRLTGSVNGQKAEQFIFDHLKSIGIEQVRFDSFSFKAWKRNTCQLEIVPYKSDNYVRFDAVSLANTGSANGIWHIIDGEDGLQSDLLKKADLIKGKCLIVNLGLSRTDSGRQNLHRAEKVALALRFGASAVIFVHPVESNILLTGTASLTGDEVSIPALCVSGLDGKMIRQWLKSERIMAEMKVQNEISNGSARNVVATIQAGIPTKETILFCGHLDSWDLATGAVDNGIGAFALLDIAAAIQKEQAVLKRNVVILWTMGEELGLLGSRHFVSDLKDKRELQSIRAVYNLDMTGNPVGINDFDWPEASSFFDKVDPCIALHVPSFKRSRVHSAELHSDHQPFMLEGIPTFSSVSEMPDSIYRCYHANCDLINLVRQSDMERSALVHSLLALQLSTSLSLPFSPMNERKLVKWLKKHQLKEKLEISKEWRWK